MRNIFTLITALIICRGIHAQGKQLWVNVIYGGINGRGAFLAADSLGNNFHVVYSCDSTGSEPLGEMVEADNGGIYGITSTGGCADSCVIYEYDPLTGVFTDIHDFACMLDSGYGAFSGLIRGADGNLYGTTGAGGAGGDTAGGVIYSVWPSDNSYHVLYSFTDSSGAAPMAPLLQLSDGKFYGTTTRGGSDSSGVIFSFSPGTSAYTVLHNFKDTSGNFPRWSPLIQAADGKLYGTTAAGGLNGYGVIYSLALAGNVYTVVHHFDNNAGGVPFAGLLQATDGKLYGTTTSGGLSNSGVIFRFDPANNNYTVLHNFNTTDGLSPSRSLTQPANGKLFGTAEYGGAHLAGAVFSYDIAADSFAVVYEFDDVTGSTPDCGVFEYTSVITTRANTLNRTPGLALSPNPATSSVSITVSEDLIGATATLSDITGRKMMAVQLTTYHLPLITSDFESGVYFITVSASDGRNVSKKLIIEK